MIDLSAFGHRRLAELMALLNVIEAAGISDIRFARKAVAEELARDRKREIAAARGRGPGASKIGAAAKCSVCGAPATVAPVNISRCTRVGGPWRSALSCRNPVCRHTEFSELEVAAWR